MKRLTLTILACLTLPALASLSAQDLTITNARIIAPNGAVIERGSIVVRAGKIVSVAPGAPSAAAPPDLTRTHHEHMTTRPPGETDDGAKARHLAWLNNQAALRPPRIRETCQKHGRGYWQGTYGDGPVLQGPRDNPQLPGHLHDRLARLPDQPDRALPEILVELPARLSHRPPHLMPCVHATRGNPQVGFPASQDNIWPSHGGTPGIATA